MRVKKMLIGGVLVGGFALGAAFGPTFGLAEDVPAKVQPYNNNGQFARMGNYMGHYFQGAMHGVVADKLGMTAEELYQARLDGKSIADLLEAKEIDVDKVVNELVADREVELKQMVKDKVITQYQMDFMLEQQKANIEAMVNVEGVGPGIYRGGGYMNQNPQQGMGMGRRGGMGGCPMW